jgi:hypothetical protein
VPEKDEVEWGNEISAQCSNQLKGENYESGGIINSRMIAVAFSIW